MITQEQQDKAVEIFLQLIEAAMTDPDIIGEDGSRQNPIFRALNNVYENFVVMLSPLD